MGDDDLQCQWTRCKARGEVATTLGSGSGAQDRSNGEELQQDVDQHDGARDGRLVSGREAIRPTVQKSVVSRKAAHDGEENVVQKDDNR